MPLPLFCPPIILRPPMTEVKIRIEAGQGSMEIPPGSEYLRGNTSRCQGNSNTGGCLNRVTTPGDELCTECHATECNDELRDLIAKEKTSRDGKWYVKWMDPGDVSHFVCVTCDRRWETARYGYQIPAMNHPLGNGSKLAQTVPIAGCCTNISRCAAARLFWGPDQYEAELELERLCIRDVD